jgi:hypothetical protein
MNSCSLLGIERWMKLVHRLAYNGDVAAGQLAVFQGGPSRTGGKAHIWMHMGRASNAEKQPTARGPEGCVENGPAAALLVGYVPHQFYAPAIQV